MKEKTPRKKMSAGAKMLIAAGLLLITAVVQYLYFNGFGFGVAGSQDYRMTSTQKGVTYDFSDSASFYCHDARFFYFCTKDGMKYVSSNGDVKWPEIFSLTRPIMVTDGDIAAVGEAKGRHIYVFNPDGLMYDVSFDNPVLYFSVNAGGYLSVILQLDKGYAIHVYHQRRATPLFEYPIHDTLVQPVAADVSEDGKYIVIGMLDMNVRLNSRAYFYYINEQDAWSTEDGLFAWEDYPDQWICSVKFMADYKALVVTDTQIACYQPGEGNALNELWMFEPHNKLDLLEFYNGTRFAYVTGDKLLNDEEALEPGTVQIYDMNGAQTGEFAMGRKATYLSMGHDAVIVGAERSFYALNSHGGRLWEYITQQDTRQFLFLENTDTVLMVGGTRAEILKREKPKVTEVPPDAYLEPTAEP